MTLTPEHRNRALKVAALLAAEFPDLQIKSIAEVVRDYENRLTRFAYEVLNSKSDAIDFRRAHKAMLQDMGNRVSVEGWREGGGKAEDFGDEETAYVDDWIRGQQGFVNDFAAWLASTDEDGNRNNEGKRSYLATRIGQWVGALQNLGDILRMKAKGDPFLTFDGDDGDESCDECQEYKGQRHKLSWWEKRGLIARNGNENFTCGRWTPCNHHFYDDNGKVVIQ